MPNSTTHARAGLVVGACAAGYSARSAPTTQMLVELAGGLVGGWLGGILPDILEPAHDPNHRRMAHSVAAGGALTLAKVAEWQAHCRTAADAASVRADGQPEGSADRARHQRDALLWRAAAGMLLGLVAGYASHLALDACTPRGLPIIGL